MRRHILALSSFLLLAVGCSHSRARLPEVPASHGRLSKALDLYKNDFPDAAAEFVPAASELAEPKLVVEPAQAPAIHDEAVAVLREKPTPEMVDSAMEDLRATCRAGHKAACDFLREEFEPPVNISTTRPEYTNEAMRNRTFGVVVIRCLLGANGRFQDCQVLESAPHGLTESVLAYTKRANYQPARFAGNVFAIPYTVTINFMPGGMSLTLAQRIEVAKQRTQRFPKSPPAWAHLANLLSRINPDDPAYVESLRALNALTPSYWWPANELAWLHVQGGRHTEAAPLVKVAMTWEPDNAYVLETSAAVLAGTGQCEQALAEQRRAVEKLPAEWPALERERFTRKLEEYQRGCAGTTP